MRKLAKVCGVAVVWVLTGLAYQPCEVALYAQTREEQIFCETEAANPCSYPQCAYLTYCNMPVYSGDSEPICCGSGVDCRCDWYGGNPAMLNGGDRYCSGGWSYCCGHDQCCRDGGWFFCLTGCWIWAGIYC